MAVLNRSLPGLAPEHTTAPALLTAGKRRRLGIAGKSRSPAKARHGARRSKRPFLRYQRMLDWTKLPATVHDYTHVQIWQRKLYDINFSSEKKREVALGFRLGSAKRCWTGPSLARIRYSDSAHALCRKAAWRYRSEQSPVACLIREKEGPPSPRVFFLSQSQYAAGSSHYHHMGVETCRE